MHSYIVPTTIDGVPVGQWSGRNAVEQRAADALARNPTVDEAIKYLQQDAGTGAAQEWLTANAGRIKDASKTGRMYEVNINAQPEQFLNYDVPFSQQSPQVQQALRSMSFQPHRFEKGATGAEALGSDFVPKGQLSLPRYVDEGIPGIKYLDQGSRRNGMANGLISQYGTPEKALEVAQQKLQAATSDFDRQSWTQAIDQLTNPKTSNYVLFRDDIIDILRKYGLAGGAALPFAFSPSDNASQDMSQ
jgi:hypothetical protein